MSTENEAYYDSGQKEARRINLSTDQDRGQLALKYKQVAVELKNEEKSRLGRISTSHSAYQNPMLGSTQGFKNAALFEEVRSIKTASSKYRNFSNKTKEDVQTVYNSTRYEEMSEREYDPYRRIESQLTKVTMPKLVNQQS